MTCKRNARFHSRTFGAGWWSAESLSFRLATKKTKTKQRRTVYWKRFSVILRSRRSSLFAATVSLLDRSGILRLVCHQSRLRPCDDHWMRFGLAAVEDARALDVGFIGRGFGGRGPLFSFQFSFLARFVLLHLRDTLRGKVEPFTQQDLAVLRLSVGGGSFEAFFDQSVCQETVAELCRFFFRLIALGGSENVHAFFVRKLGQSF